MSSSKRVKSGMAIGVSAGAAIGTVIPGIGTAVGVIIGGAVGAIMGFALSKKRKNAIKDFFKKLDKHKEEGSRSDSSAVNQSSAHVINNVNDKSQNGVQSNLFVSAFSGRGTFFKSVNSRKDKKGDFSMENDAGDIKYIRVSPFSARA